MSKSLTVLKELWKTSVTAEQFPFLYEQALEYEKLKPLGGTKILHSIPCSIEAACKALILAIGGAEVVVRSMHGIIPASQEHALSVLKKAGIRYIGETLPKDEVFDIYLDCSAELASMPAPNLGAVELTQSGSMIYLNQDLSYPVYSLDLTKVKMIETYMGTGESFCRAFDHLVPQGVAQHSFLVFGCGKVGSGVIHHLHEKGAKVFGIDTDPKALSLVASEASDTASFDSKEKIKSLINQATCIVTATGKQGFISEHFSPEDFKDKILANIGAEDEFGSQFSKESVLHGKQPINFALADPTILHYLDPVFFTHSKAAELLIHHKPSPGVHAIPKEIDEKICARWHELHREELPFLKTRDALTV